MEARKLKCFARYARRYLLEYVSAKLELVLPINSAARIERAECVKKLEEAIKKQGKKQVAEQVAYIWFNCFCALRFMDVNRYNQVKIVSRDPGQFLPEILEKAKMGQIDNEIVQENVRQQIFALLNLKENEKAYRLLVIAACNFLKKTMPFLFESIDGYSDLLLPDDLLSGSSILAYTCEAMTPDVCKDVEVIWWLYQFYVSEKKGRKAKIPAATQLFIDCYSNFKASSIVEKTR